MVGKRWLPKYVTVFTDRHGKFRYRYRRGKFSRYFSHRPGSQGFLEELDAFMSECESPKINLAKKGSMADLAHQFYGTAKWKGMKPSTRATYGGIIDRFMQEHGNKPVMMIETRHIDSIIGNMSDRPQAANNLRKVLRLLLRYAVKFGMRRDNPVDQSDSYSSKTDGFHAWTEEEIKKFREVHSLGTRARLAMELMLWTGSRRSDVIRLGKQHIQGDYFEIRNQKTEKILTIWISPVLQDVLAAMPKSDHLNFLTTKIGKPFTVAGFGNWFRDKCDEAGLHNCAAHGLRKAIARRAADLGATQQQLKAVGGWAGDKEVSQYTATANQKALAENGISLISDWEMSNLHRELDKEGK